MSINSVTLLGRIGQDLELKHLPSGSAVCNFTLATSKKWNDKDGNKQESTEWHSVVVFGKQAEATCKYLGKGSQALIIGELNTRTFEVEGIKKYKTEIKVHQIEFLGLSDGSGEQAVG